MTLHNRVVRKKGCTFFIYRGTMNAIMYKERFMRMLRYLMDQIEKSPTAFHAVAAVRQELEENGYRPLASGELPSAGGKYYLSPYGRSLLAFRMPTTPASGCIITASHADSPCFRVRQRPELVGEDYVRLSIEPYGGMINDSWLDRPLSVAGRVMVRTETGIMPRLVDFSDDTVLIPRVAIHLNRDVNNGYRYDPARDLTPLYGVRSSAGSFQTRLAALAQCTPEDILASELYVYNNQSCCLWGAQDEFLSAPRLDDLSCVFSCTKAFLSCHDGGSVPMLCIFDNEEIGSQTKQGAAAPTLPRLLGRIAQSLHMDEDTLLGNSLFLSCDNGHGRHPNRPELSDATEAPVLGGGVVIKHSPRYATDAMAEALFTQICRRANVPVQYYANRPDQQGGATLGNIANMKTPIAAVDIGMAQLAMHSCYETMSSGDVSTFTDAMTACYQAALRWRGKGMELL